MKLTYKDKVQVYELRNKGEASKAFKYIWDKNSLIFGMIKLIDRYGIEFVKRGGIVIILLN